MLCTAPKCSRPLDESQRSRDARFCSTTCRVAVHKAKRAEQRAAYVAESRRLNAAIVAALAVDDVDLALNLAKEARAVIDRAEGILR